MPDKGGRGWDQPRAITVWCRGRQHCHLPAVWPVRWEQGRVVGDSSVCLRQDGRGPSQARLTFPHLLSSAPIQEVDAAEIQVQVCLYAFDLIYLNGEVSSGFTSRGSRGVSLGASGLSFSSHCHVTELGGHSWAVVLHGPRSCVGPQDPPGVWEALPTQLHICEADFLHVVWLPEADVRIQSVLS